jgi:L-rhamnose isomerase
VKSRQLESFYLELRGEPADPLLEAKLELLHRLLVPPSHLAELENSDGLWTKLINLVDESKKSEIQAAWNTFKNGFRTEYSAEPFNGDYLKLLTDFRDALLPEHE